MGTVMCLLCWYIFSISKMDLTVRWPFGYCKMYQHAPLINYSISDSEAARGTTYLVLKNENLYIVKHKYKSNNTEYWVKMLIHRTITKSVALKKADPLRTKLQNLSHMKLQIRWAKNRHNNIPDSLSNNERIYRKLNCKFNEQIK